MNVFVSSYIPNSLIDKIHKVCWRKIWNTDHLPSMSSLPATDMLVPINMVHGKITYVSGPAHAQCLESIFVSRCCDILVICASSLKDLFLQQMCNESMCHMILCICNNSWYRLTSNCSWENLYTRPEIVRNCGAKRWGLVGNWLDMSPDELGMYHKKFEECVLLACKESNVVKLK